VYDHIYPYLHNSLKAMVKPVCKLFSLSAVLSPLNEACDYAYLLTVCSYCLPWYHAISGNLE